MAGQTPLGSVRTRSGAAEATVKARCQKATAAKIIYQRKLQGNKVIPLKSKGAGLQGFGASDAVLRIGVRAHAGRVP